jgi:alkylation response protein AidB-like acyl-CoA dehydrogenase
MTDNLLNFRDVDFQLYEVLDVLSLTARPRFAEHDRETFDSILATARQLAEDYFEPYARKADEHEPVFKNAAAVTIPETAAAVKAHAEAGFLAAHHDSEVGGMQLPATVSGTCATIFKAANIGFAAYPLLTTAAGNLIRSHGTAEQQKLYLAPLLDGRATGTMALTEPHAGSSLGDLRTSAVPHEDGSYRISGNKIFISGGEHDFGTNIIHLVLARIKGAPAGVKGISLFIVPKLLVNPDGSFGERNDITLAGLLHKMGYRATTSTVLNFGDKGGAVGYLIGEPGQGLKYMFHMMNEARIGVGMGAVALGYTGYLHSLEYARSRPQGRPLGGKDPNAPQVPIVQHSDVRRMLLAQKSYVEVCFGLCLYASRLVDEIRTGEEAERAHAQELLDLLTPVVKAASSQYGCKANELAIQVLGGAGYTRDYPLEMFYRDNRLNPIHEGTDGIQSLDLLGRKLWQNGGAGLQALAAEVAKTLEQARELEQTRELVESLEQAQGRVLEVVQTLGQALQSAGPEAALANSFVFLDLFSRFVLAWQWLRQAVVAARALKAGAAGEDTHFYQGKLQAARYFHRWELPQIQPQAELLMRLDPTCYDMRDAWF